MARLLSRFTHREGYKVHVDPAVILGEARDEHGPVLTMRDGTVVKLINRPEERAANVLALMGHY